MRTKAKRLDAIWIRTGDPVTGGMRAVISGVGAKGDEVSAVYHQNSSGRNMTADLVFRSGEWRFKHGFSSGLHADLMRIYDDVVAKLKAILPVNTKHYYK